MTTTVRSVTLVWRIENFSCCLYETGDYFYSPAFQVAALDGTDWYLELYPRGKIDKDNIDVGILREAGDSSVEECEISLLASDGSSLVSKIGDVIYSNVWAVLGLIKRKEVFGSKRIDLLPDDTLTVRCRLRGKATERLKQSETFLARTRFGSKQDSFTWPIKGFNTLHTKEGIITKVKDSSKNKFVLKYKIYKQIGSVGKDMVKMDVSLIGCDRRVYSVFNVLVLDNSGNWVKFAESRDWLAVHGTVTLTSTFTYDNLRKDNGTYLSEGMLQLRCEYLLRGVILSEKIENDRSLNRNRSGLPQSDKLSQNSIGRDFQCLYEEGILSDFSLRVGTKTFSVHKAILGARSPLFKTMFTVDRKRSDSMDIPDVAEETLQKILLFVYSDQVEEDMPWESASKLYSAADKYAITPLKRRCSTILKFNTCTSNIFDILVLADMHKDQDLKSSLQDFVVSHYKEVVGTNEWNAFQNKYPQLANKLLIKLYMKRRN